MKSAGAMVCIPNNVKNTIAEIKDLAKRDGYNVTKTFELAKSEPWDICEDAHKLSLSRIYCFDLRMQILTALCFVKKLQEYNIDLIDRYGNTYTEDLLVHIVAENIKSDNF